MNILIFTLIALQLFDVISTKKALANGGYETNPIIAKVLDRFGFEGLIVVKTAIAAILIYYAEQIPMIMLVALNILYVIVVYNNFKVAGK